MNWKVRRQEINEIDEIKRFYVNQSRKLFTLKLSFVQLFNFLLIFLLLFILDRSSSYVAFVDLSETKDSVPDYSSFTVSGGKREVVLSKGDWELELSSTSAGLLVVSWVFFYFLIFHQDKLVSPYRGSSTGLG